MNDPLKKYIQDNRDEFDHLEPSADILSKLRGKLKDKPKEKKGIILLMTNHKWMVAASILVLLSVTYLLIPTSRNATQTFTKNQLPKVVKEEVVAVNETNKEISKPILAFKAQTRKRKTTPTKLATDIDMLTAYKNLTDSTSASNRLAAILAIQNSTMISYDIIDKLAKTLNHDSNSNVRLAALDLMSKYAQDSYVSNTFMLSLNNQKDPLVQLGLIELLSHTNNPKLDDKLYALANDPTTFAAVKDQAYLILLNQNKL